MRGHALLGTIAIVSAPLTGCDDAPPPEPIDVSLRLVLENIAEPGSGVTEDGTPYDILVAPGVWTLHEEDYELLSEGVSASNDLEALAEWGSTDALEGTLMQTARVAWAGTFGTEAPGENYEDNPLAPGDQVVLELPARTGQRLSLAAMYIQSNDVLLGTRPEGIEVAHELEVGTPLDVSDAFVLWDAGTEINEAPGLGEHQAPRQPEPNSGPDEAGTLTMFETEDASGFTYPAPVSFWRVTLERTR